MIEKFVQAGIINPLDMTLLQEEALNSGKRIVFIDATFVLPTSEENVHQNYTNKRIPEAVFFDIKNIADKTSSLPHMLPDESEFGRAMSDMGIRNDDILILYGQHGMLMGPPRVWWMLKGFGHENVLVLNGGLPAWEKAHQDIDHGQAPSVEKSHYSASSFNPSMVINMPDMIEASNGKTCPILDARPAARFNGESPEPREGMRSGHMPNALNLHASLLVDANGMFKPPEKIEELFEQCGVFKHNEEPPNHIITTCGSGITACVLALALYHLDYKNVSVYDGSWSEWGLESSPTPVTTATG